MYLVKSKIGGKDDEPLKHGQKRVWFIRHGQSFANLAGKVAEKDPSYRDAILSDLGYMQASMLQPIVTNWQPDCIISSPLRRALQTACIAFSRTNQPPIVISHLCTENWPNSPQNMGNKSERLIDDYHLRSLQRYPTIDWNSTNVLNTNWWEVGDDSKRYSYFAYNLQQCPYSKIAVVSHWGFIKSFMQHANQTVALDNCQWITTTWQFYN
jgi:broad specificity phosphatase PhoE